MITLHIIDEINACFSGLSKYHINTIIERTKIMEKGAHMTAAFKTKMWDGKTSLFREDGYFFLFMLEKVMAILEEMGVSENDIVVEDHRREIQHDTTGIIVDKDFFEGFTLWDHQVSSLNAIIQNEQGILDSATSSGKSVVMALTCYIYNDWYKSLTITPSEFLVNQLYEEYSQFLDGVTTLTSSVPKKKRQQHVNEADHVITTHKLFTNECSLFEDNHDFGVFLYDECQDMGEKLLEAIKSGTGDMPIRVGLTGTVPNNKDKLRKERLFCHVGNSVIDYVDPQYLMENQYASHVTIYGVPIEDKKGEDKIEEIGTDFWSWEYEHDYMNKTEDRIDEIVHFIHQKWDRNTMVMTRREIGYKIAEKLGVSFIDKDTSNKEREKIFSQFTNDDTQLIVATYGTSSRGISVNDIYQLILVDVGSNEKYIGQSIGRAMRLDGMDNEAIVWDVHSNNLVFSSKQKVERKRYYKRRGFDFVDNKEFLKVE